MKHKLIVILMMAGCLIGAEVVAAEKKSCSAKPACGQVAAIQFDKLNPTLSFGAGELRGFLERTTALRFADAAAAPDQGWHFTLVEDAAMEPYSFAVSCRREGKAVVVKLFGPDPACVLHAIYTFLEEAGIRFEITGAVLPDRVDLEKLIGCEKTIKPVVARRGIRFHMNFPQDISSYPLEEAKEYIRNMARMRMNFATFHSYPGRLHNGIYKDTTEYAGRLYEERMEIPDDPAIRGVVRNKKFYRTPELEAYIDMPRTRAGQMKEWTGSVFEEVKRMGMYLQFSFEPRLESIDHINDMFWDIIKAYPMIDALEFMTNENGGGGNPDPDALQKVLVDYYDGRAMSDPVLAPLLKDPPESLVTIIQELGHNLRGMQSVQRKYEQASGKQFAAGVYAIPLRFSQVASRMMSLYAPAGVDTVQMPEYGSRAVAQRVAELPLSPADWKRTTIYGWYEFDGMFFLQQTHVAGECDLIRTMLDKSQLTQLHGLAFNLWSTAENRTSVRYGALATIEGPKSPQQFYREYATQMKMGPPDLYVQAMDQIDQAILRARETWNLGFGWGWMWVGLWNHTFAGWKAEALDDVQKGYESALANLNQVAAETADGRAYLDLLRNRVQCSIYHIEAVKRVFNLFPMLVQKDNHNEPVAPASLTDAQRQQVRQACQEATYYVNLYLGTRAKLTPDRGSEGVLMNYYSSLPQLILKLRGDYGGEKDVALPTVGESKAWPAPAKTN